MEKIMLPEIPVSGNYSVYANGREISVFHTKAADFAVICFSGSIDLTVKTKRGFDNAAVRPLRRDYNVKINPGENEIRLRLSNQDRVSVEPYGLENPLFIFCAEYIKQPDSATHIFSRGTITDIGRITLKSGDCVYIEEGAVVIGCFFADGEKDITITGNGMIWGLPMHEHPAIKRPAPFLAVECENIKISGISAIEAATWTIVPTACKNVSITGINIIAHKMSSDGIDIVGCENVDISRCFICVNDDCIAIKAVGYFDERGKKNVKNIRSSDCILWNLPCGNAVEIGYETSCEEISSIIFENIDVIHCQYEGWQSGGVFTIHNGDRAHVKNVAYRDIYVEDAQEKLIDIKILSSKYSTDSQRGKVSDITFENIYVRGDVLPPSIIRGYEADDGTFELITNVKASNLFLNGKKITGRLEAHVIAELSKDINFD
jgi:polygalacturonase